MFWIIIFSLIIYTSLIFLIFIGICKEIHRTDYLKYRSNNYQDISIVIAARNEEKNIFNLINALLSQNYPLNKMEIIIVNDRSTDKTEAILENFQKLNPELIKVIQVSDVPSDLSPKKFALEKGILLSKYPIIITTDADCSPGCSWINEIINEYEDDVGLVTSFSPPFIENFREKTFLQKLLNLFSYLEALSLSAISMGSIGIGFPLTCTGRNLSYRKKTFEEVEGFSKILHYISGDDDLLLHLISRLTKWKCRYKLSSYAVVQTIPQIHFKEFFNARLRHASKGVKYALPITSLLILIYLVHLCFAIGILFFYPIIVPVLIIKSIQDILLLNKIANGGGTPRWPLLFIPLFEVFHIFYVTILAPLGCVKGFNWKGKYFSPIFRNNERQKADV